jgi:hypothetical protein
MGPIAHALLIACWFCHAELYRRRPPERHLTSFYLLIAAGGAAGAFFVGVLAPVLFNANYEVACGLVFVAMLAVPATWSTWLTRLLWVALVIAAVAFFVLQVRHYHQDVIALVRSFYGAMRVEETGSGDEAIRTLYHGLIQHGNQYLDPERRKQPTTYYGHATGVGLALDLCCPSGGEARPRRVGIIGLGTGTVAAYGRPGDVFRFYEIDPRVEQIARTYFTYLQDSSAHIEIVLGDARLSLARELASGTPQHYDVLVVDAFSGDAIPVHLLTREAIALYRSHLAPGGILAIHVSNQYIDLAPEVQLLAQNANLPAVLLLNEDDEEANEVFESDWVVVTNNEAFLGRSEVQEHANQIKPRKYARLWTDDYSSLLPLLKRPATQ